MQEEMSADNNDAMQEQIKQWTKLGFVIDQNKGKLQSFDEVINLQATDTTIPEVGTPSVNWAEYGGLNGEDPAKRRALNMHERGMGHPALRAPQPSPTGACLLCKVESAPGAEAGAGKWQGLSRCKPLPHTPRV